MIRFSDFSFTYASQSEPTLKHIDLEIKDGEKVLIIGPSGSGKSTLGNAINGLVPHSMEGSVEGSLEISGIDAASSDVFSISQKVGTVLQDTDGQFVGLSVAEDIAFSLENQMVPQERMRKVVLDSAALVDMESFLSQPPGDLSGGQKQRVSIAGVLVDDVDILLFDEPLANLDPATGLSAMRLIDDLHRRTGKIVIIIEHRIEDVLSYPVDRIVLIEDGRITLNTDTESLLRSDALHSAGIREPLYISALKAAGCDIANCSGSLSPVEAFDPEPYREKLISFLKEHERKAVRPEGEIIAALDDVSFSYDGRRDVLQHVSFSIRKGEMVSLLGKNGAGKSTIASMLMGIIRPDSGSISINGRDASSDTIAMRSRTVGFVMQNPNHMISHPMIYDEVAFALRERGMDEEEIEKRVLSALELCGLGQYWKWPVSALSYGQKKRVTIASIIVLQPEILILDEPTAGQDWRHYTELMRYIRRLNEELGITIIFVTHDMHLALEYTDRSIVIADGVILRDGEIGTVFSDRMLLESANLRVTSLYELGRRIGLDESGIASFIRTFMQREDDDGPDGQVSQSPVPELSASTEKGRKKGRKKAKEEKRFGFGLSYIDIESPIHSLTGVTKFLVFAMWLAITIVTFDIRILAVMLIAAIAAMKASRIPFRRFLPLMCVMLGFMLVNAFFIYLFSPQQGPESMGHSTVILGPEGGMYSLTLETVIYLITVSMKYLAIFPMALMFVYATHPSEFASSLNRLHFSYRLSYSVALMLRYIPEITDDYMHIMHAQMARGVDISRNVRLMERIRSVARVLAPLVLSSLERIDTISNAMVLRGFGRCCRRTWYMSRPMKAMDYAAIAATALLLALAAVLRFGFGIRFWYPF